MSIFALTISLFLVFNAMGNVPVFVGLLSKYTVKKQRLIILRENLIALVILLIFNFFGYEVLRTIGISRPTIGIAGGTLLFIIALSMIFPPQNDHADVTQHEPMIVPLATPLIAGPGTISTVMVYSEHVANPWILTLIILMAWVPSCLILLASSNIKYIFGKRGLLACQKLGGMLISLFAVQMVCTGAITLLKEAFPTTTEYNVKDAKR